MALTLLLTALLGTGAAVSPDYAALYDGGITFSTFMEKATSRQEQWRQVYNDAAVSPDAVAALRALPERRRLLVVAEDWCGDSVRTVPYLVRLADGAPERIALRIINSTVGLPVMEAHRTADGRAGTPTVVVLGEDGRFIAAWSERPDALQAWVTVQKKTRPDREVHDAIQKWYDEDAGKSATSEILALLAR